MTRLRVAVGLLTPVVVLAVWLRPAGGGDTGGGTWTTTTRPLDFGGASRSYLLIRPAGVNAASGARLPVLVVLHGHSATPESEADRTGFQDAVGGAAILVYPAGVGGSWNAGGCCPPASDQGVDDVGFITAVVHDVLANQPDADPHAVWAAGYSNGARMVYKVACDAPDLFTGLAAVGQIATGACDHPAPVSLIQVEYTGDPGLNPIDVDHQMAALRSTDGCVGDGQRALQGEVTVMRWDACGHNRLERVDYAGESHGWPAGNFFTPSAQSLIWQFFTGLRAAS